MATSSPTPRHPASTSRILQRRPLVYAFAFAEPLAIAALKVIFPEVAEAPFLLFFSGIALVAAVGGFLPGLVATATSAALAALLFLPPAGSLVLSSGEHAGHVVLFAVEGSFVTVIVGALRARRPLHYGRGRPV